MITTTEYTAADKNCHPLADPELWVPVGIQAHRKLRPYIYRYGPRLGQERVDYYAPFNPRTRAQQAWRKVYANAVAAWQSLTDDQKEVWRDRATRSYLNGYCLMLQDYLLTHTVEAWPFTVGTSEVGGPDFIGYGRHWTVASSRVGGGDTIKGPPPG